MTIHDLVDALTMLAAGGFAAALLAVALWLARWVYWRRR